MIEHERLKISLSPECLAKTQSGILLLIATAIMEAIVFVASAVLAEFVSQQLAISVFCLGSLAAATASILGVYKCGSVRATGVILLFATFFASRIVVVHWGVLPWSHPVLVVVNMILLAFAARGVLRSLVPLATEMGDEKLSEYSCRAGTTFVATGAICVGLFLTGYPTINAAQGLVLLWNALVILGTGQLFVMYYRRAKRAIPAGLCA